MEPWVFSLDRGGDISSGFSYRGSEYFVLFVRVLFLFLSKLETIEDSFNVLGRTKRSFLLSLLAPVSGSSAAARHSSNTAATLRPVAALVSSCSCGPQLQLRGSPAAAASSLRVRATTMGLAVLRRTCNVKYYLLDFNFYTTNFIVRHHQSLLLQRKIEMFPLETIWSLNTFNPYCRDRKSIVSEMEGEM